MLLRYYKKYLTLAWPLHKLRQDKKIKPQKEDAMKTALRTVVAIVGGTASAFASGGATLEDGSLLTTLFLGFGVCIFVFQLVPAAVLFAAMIKGLFSAGPEKATVATEKELG
jgi:hypothetical protein